MRPVSARGPSQRVCLALAVLVMTSALAHGSGAAPTGAPDDAAAVSVAAHLASLYGHNDALEVPTLPLEDAMRMLHERIGGPAPDAAVLATLEPELAAPLGHLASAMVVAHDAREAAYAQVDDEALLEWLGREEHAPGWLRTVDTHLVERAALTMAQAVDDVRPELARLAKAPHAPALSTARPPAIDLAPVLVVDPDGVDNLHTRDAVLVVDLGGDDTYDTNAGGALIHLGFVGDPSSCQLHVLGVGVGCENEDALVAFSAGLLIDVSGDDTYGVYKPPRPRSHDAQCTTDPIIRRVVVQGSGSGGIGMLVDLAGHDAYRGKTLAQGNGHLGGAGALYDMQGDDSYAAIRSAMGSSVLGGTGTLYDGAGADTYTFRAPAGGLFNVDQFRCDDTARLGLGAAVLAGTGHFRDVSGNDVYRIDAQGLGHAAAPDVATFVDSAGHDDYDGYAGRGNNVTQPGPGTFVDHES